MSREEPPGSLFLRLMSLRYAYTSVISPRAAVSRAEELGRHAHASPKSRFTPMRIAKRFASYYDEALDSFLATSIRRFSASRASAFTAWPRRLASWFLRRLCRCRPPRELPHIHEISTHV